MRHYTGRKLMMKERCNILRVIKSVLDRLVFSEEACGFSGVRISQRVLAIN